MKCGGLWSSLGIGRFRCLHSSLMRAIRCANSEHSALNAGVPTDPHSPESNSSYLARIWSIKELYSLCASCTVIKETGLGMIRSDKYQFVMSIQSIQPKHVFTQWNLRANWSNRLEIWGMSTLSIQASWKSPSRVLVGRDQRDNLVRLANYANELSGKWLEILIESSRQKLVCKKSKFCKIQGMSILSIHAACNEIRSHPNSFHCICRHCQYTYNRITM